MKGQGFTIIGVNGFEPANLVRSFRKVGKVTFPLVVNGKGSRDVVSKYRVVYYPTTYLLDSRGRVVARFEGYDDKILTDMKAALKKLGLRPI